MSCTQIQQLLLQLPTSRFPELSEHLGACPDCRSLADEILTREQHVDQYLDDYIYAETFDAALAQARAVVPAAASGPAVGRWIMPALVGLAAAAAVALALRGGPSGPNVPGEPGAGAPLAPLAPAVEPRASDEEPLEAHVLVGVGRSAVVRLDWTPEWISAVLPELVTVTPMGSASQLLIHAKRPGRTMLQAGIGDDRVQSWWIEISPDATIAPQSEAPGVVLPRGEALSVRTGGRLQVDRPDGLKAITVIDPELVEITLVGSSLQINGLAQGTTDVVLASKVGADPLVYTVTVRP